MNLDNSLIITILIGAIIITIIIGIIILIKPKKTTKQDNKTEVLDEKESLDNNKSKNQPLKEIPLKKNERLNKFCKLRLNTSLYPSELQATCTKSLLRTNISR